MADRQRAFSGSSFEEAVGYCRAVRVDDRIWVAGTAPVWPDGSVAEDAGEQARRCFEIIGAALTELGSSLSDVVRVRQYLVDVTDADAVSAVHAELFSAVRPVNTTVVVAGLFDPRWKVEIEVDAVASTR